MKKTELEHDEQTAKEPVSTQTMLEELSQTRMELEVGLDIASTHYHEALDYRKEVRKNIDQLELICRNLTRISQHSESATIQEDALDYALRVTRFRNNLMNCFVPDLTEFIVNTRRVTMNTAKQKLLENQIKMDNLKAMMKGGADV